MQTEVYVYPYDLFCTLIIWVSCLLSLNVAYRCTSFCLYLEYVSLSKLTTIGWEVSVSFIIVPVLDHRQCGRIHEAEEEEEYHIRWEKSDCYRIRYCIYCRPTSFHGHDGGKYDLLPFFGLMHSWEFPTARLRIKWRRMMISRQTERGREAEGGWRITRP